MTISNAGVRLCIFVTPDAVPTVRNRCPSTTQLWPSKSIWKPTFGPETLKWLWLIGGNSLKCWKQQLVAARLLRQMLQSNTRHAEEALTQVNKVLRSSRLREKMCLYSKERWSVLCNRTQFLWLWISYFWLHPRASAWLPPWGETEIQKRLTTALTKVCSKVWKTGWISCLRLFWCQYMDNRRWVPCYPAAPR